MRSAESPNKPGVPTSIDTAGRAKPAYEFAVLLGAAGGDRAPRQSGFFIVAHAEIKMSYHVGRAKAVGSELDRKGR
jgi:hypothetical protein